MMATAPRDVQRRNNAGGEEEALPCRLQQMLDTVSLGEEGGSGRPWLGMPRSFGERGLKNSSCEIGNVSPPLKQSEAKEDLEALLHGIYTVFFQTENSSIVTNNSQVRGNRNFGNEKIK